MITAMRLGARIRSHVILQRLAPRPLPVGAFMIVSSFGPGYIRPKLLTIMDSPLGFPLEGRGQFSPGATSQGRGRADIAYQVEGVS
jgi:hypothetical protein